MKTNFDKIKEYPLEWWAEFYYNLNICPYRFGSKRRGRYKTCPYPSRRLGECKQCWTEWLNMKSK